MDILCNETEALFIEINRDILGYKNKFEWLASIKENITEKLILKKLELFLKNYDTLVYLTKKLSYNEHDEFLRFMGFFHNGIDSVTELLCVKDDRYYLKDITFFSSQRYINKQIKKANQHKILAEYFKKHIDADVLVNSIKNCNKKQKLLYKNAFKIRLASGVFYALHLLEEDNYPDTYMIKKLKHTYTFKYRVNNRKTELYIIPFAEMEYYPIFFFRFFLFDNKTNAMQELDIHFNGNQYYVQCPVNTNEEILNYKIIVTDKFVKYIIKTEEINIKVEQ